MAGVFVPDLTIYMNLIDFFIIEIKVSRRLYQFLLWVSFKYFNNLTQFNPPPPKKKKSPFHIRIRYLQDWQKQWRIQWIKLT